MKKLTKYDIRLSTLFSYSLYGLVKIIHPTCEWFRRCLRFLSGKPCGTKCLWRNNNLRLFSWWHAILALEALPVKSTTHQAMFTRSDNKRVECFQQKKYAPNATFIVMSVPENHKLHVKRKHVTCPAQELNSIL